MKIQRYILLSICSYIFRLSVYATTITIPLVIIFGSPNNIKNALIESKAYEKFIPSIIETNLNSKQPDGSLPLQDPEVQKIIQESFPPGLLRANTELVIDNTYGWLRGQTSTPTFVIDFSASLDKLAKELSAHAFNRMRFLPICQSEPATVDPFTANCRPEFMDLDAEEARFRELVRADNTILPQSKFTAADFPKNDKGQTVYEQYAFAPKLFPAFQYAPLIFGTIAILAGIVMVGTNHHKRRKIINSLGIGIIGSSIFVVLSPLFFVYILPRLFPGFGAGSSGNATQAVLGDAMTRLSAAFNSELISIGILMTLVGCAVVVAERGTRPKSKYIKIRKKAGMTTSNEPRTRGGKSKLNQAIVPIQTSEGAPRTSKYQKDKRYRKIPKNEI